MNLKNFGGNILKQLNDHTGRQNFTNDGPYDYFIFKSKIDNDTISIDNLNSFTVYILKKPNKSKIQILNFFEKIEEGDCIQFENINANFQFYGDTIEILVAGTQSCHPQKKEMLSLTKSNDIYKVTKPWGHELWLNKQHPCYGFKQIFIKKNTKTSLQYHQFKQETNVLFKGDGKLHYNCSDNNNLKKMMIDTIEINPLCSIDVLPPTLHRLEAITDLLLYEVSTPHLDDVIRVKDDAKRPDGRLQDEHQN